MNRTDGRSPEQLRPIIFETGYTRWAEGSVLARFGHTHVLCNVTVEDRLPGWLQRQDEPHGWLTAEYAMLPRSTQERVRRERRWPKGRTQEISRLVGRSLRMALDLQLLGRRQLIVDCDVLQADGGTRTAAGELVEIQGTAEKAPFARRQLDRLVALAAQGIGQIVDGQNRALEGV